MLAIVRKPPIPKPNDISTTTDKVSGSFELFTSHNKILYILDHKGVYVEGRQSLSSGVNGSLKLVTLPAAEEGFCTGFG